MRQDSFEQHHEPQWQRLEEILDDLERAPRLRRLKAQEHAELPRLYTQLCNDFALARGRGYSPALVEQLHRLVLRGHCRLYQRREAWGWRLLHFVTTDFPRTLRQHLRYLWLALALFALPGVLVGVGCLHDQELIYSLLDDEEVSSVEYMYRPGNEKLGRKRGRSAETDLGMFGFYISNNIGVGFRTFAGGIFYGVGAAVFLLFNGLLIGAVAGHLTRLGYIETFWPFVSGHGAFELPAIVICGAAGLMLGHALLAPGRRRRVEALREQAQPALRLVMGAAVMLVVAASLEAFWSPSAVPSVVKYSVAAGLWSLMLAYLALAGRESGGSHQT